ncbi:MAG TPA: FliH/SctL family protein [Burkholderiales bacterium]|nr:FliH/SctL family protein [Burkholderiales bacterium]
MSNPPSPKPSADDYRRWEPDRFEAGPGTPPSAIKLPTAAQIEQLQQAAQQEGYASGHQQARDEIRREVEQLRAVTVAVTREWNGCEERLAEQVVALALAVAQAIVRQQLRVHPETIVAVVRDALNELPAFTRPARLTLHPDDALLVRRHLGEILDTHGWQIIEDGALVRGDCRLAQGAAEIDATLQQRWRQVAAALGSDLAWLARDEVATDADVVDLATKTVHR